MEIIFIKDVKGHGKKGDTKEVKDGFAQNFLIKKGYAVRKTETSFKILEEEKTETKQNHEKKLEEAQAIKLKLEQEDLVFEVKTGSDDKVFGSISSKQISSALKQKNYEIDKKQIHIEEALSTLGVHSVKIELYNKIFADLKIRLAKEGK